MIGRLLKLRRDERGTSVIELALVAPILASMVIGIIDLSRAYSARLQLEQAAQRSIEKIQAGTASLSTFATLKAEAAAAAGVSPTAVQVEYWLECNGTKMTGDTMDEAYEQNCPNGQTYARYLEVRIWKNFDPVLTDKFFDVEADGSIKLLGQSGLRLQ